MDFSGVFTPIQVIFEKIFLKKNHMSGLSHTDELPNFCSKTEFCSKFERYAAINGWSEEKQMLIVPLQLKEAAEMWFDSLPADSTIKTSWQDFKDGIIDRFHDSNKDMANVQIFNTRKQKYDETVEKYFEEMKKLAKLVRDKNILNEYV